MGLLDKPKAAFRRARASQAWLDHVVRAYVRYKADAGDRLAASVTLPGFLSFFPLVALAFAVLGIVLHGDESAQRSVLDSISGYLPGILCGPGHPCGATNQIDVSKLGSAAVSAGIIGAVGLLIGGLAWVSALRAALLALWHQDPKPRNAVVRKLFDLFVLTGLGVGIGASVVVSGVANSATSHVLDWISLHGAFGSLVVRVVGIALALGVNVALFAFLFTNLGQSTEQRVSIRRGVVFAAAGLVVLQLVGATYIRHTTGNPLYGTFAVVIGLLLWINVICRFTLFAAAWTVTAAYVDDSAASTAVAEPGTREPQPEPAARPGSLLHDRAAAEAAGQKAGTIGAVVLGAVGATLVIGATRQARRALDGY
ncbi:MAG TPA: YihY/virulence factor BrkB family protein [Mycobacteriales bacterium]|nr:YihY/virulence factor BrkB family protein [Mycobacteriales bacterium]